MTSDKVRIGMAAAALLGLGLAAQGGPQAKPDKPAQGASSPAVVPMPKSDRLAMADFKKLLATGEVVVIDVRSNSAYVGGHIPGALSMPVETINSATAEKLKRLGKKVATYCAWQAENTSARAAQTLQKMGVPAQAIVGGLNTWIQEKNPIKTGPDAR